MGPTVGVDFFSVGVALDLQNAKLNIWDISGKERFRSLVASYMSDTNILILAFDISGTCFELFFRRKKL